MTNKGRKISDLNKRITAREKSFDDLEQKCYSRKSPDTVDGYIEFMNRGLEKIENSPTKHLMFAHTDYYDVESKETFIIERNGKLVEVPVDELTVEEEELIAHSGMGSGVDWESPNKSTNHGLIDYDKMSAEEKNIINDNIIENFGITLEEFAKLGMNEQLDLLVEYRQTKMQIPYPTEEQTKKSLKYVDNMRQFENEVLEDKSKVKIMKKKEL